jgi:predicted PurR-regulated permease PerM
MKKFAEWSLKVRYIVFIVVMVIAGVMFWYVRGILEPLIIAAFIAYLIHPAVNFLISRTRLSRKFAVNLVYFVSLGVFIGIPATLAPLFFDEFSRILTDVLDLINQLISNLEKPNLIPGLPVDFGQLANRLTQFRSTFLTSLPDQLLKLASKTSIGAVWLLVILVTVYYFLAKWPNLRNGFIEMFPARYHPELNELYQRLRRIWMAYLRGQLLLMLIVGVAFTIAWTAIGIPGALVLGVIAGFLTIIPDVGPFIAAALAVVVAGLEGSNWPWMATLSHLAVAGIVLVVYLVLISLKNFWLRPIIMGRSVRMHEALVLICIVLATVLWGILGALIIVPVMASLGIILDYLRRRILGMPPFSSVEPFFTETPLVSEDDQVTELRSKTPIKKPTRRKG